MVKRFINDEAFDFRTYDDEEPEVPSEEVIKSNEKDEELKLLNKEWHQLNGLPIPEED